MREITPSTPTPRLPTQPPPPAPPPLSLPAMPSLKSGISGILLLESGLLSLKSAIQLKESEITLTIGIQIQVPLTKTEIQYLESKIRGVKSRIQDCLGFPYLG